VSEQHFEHIKIEKIREENYLLISINRPEKLNALQNKTLKAISDALPEIKRGITRFNGGTQIFYMRNFDKIIRCY